jgi:hypothetical protein
MHLRSSDSTGIGHVSFVPHLPTYSIIRFRRSGGRIYLHSYANTLITPCSVETSEDRKEYRNYRLKRLFGSS